MNARRVLLRCDGGAVENVGTGHVARSLLIADVLRHRGAHVSFVGRFDSSVLDWLQQHAFEVIAASPGEPEPDLLARAVDAAQPEVLVLDRLDTHREDIEGVRRAVPIVIAVDDRGDGAALADIVVNPIVRGGDAPYDGYDYVVVTPPEEAKRAARERPRVVITFGGYDHRGYGDRVAATLAERVDAEVLWLARSSDAPAGPVPSAVTRLDDAPDFASLLAGADVAVVAGGLTLFEALANGVPTVALAQYPHQAETIARLAASGAVIAIDNEAEDPAEAASKAVSELVADAEARARLGRRAIEAVDGRGLHRFADLVEVFAPLRWDSAYFGIPIGRIHPVRLTPGMLEFALGAADDHGIRCLYYLCDCHHAESVRLAESAGFHFVDIRLTFERGLPPVAVAFEADAREATERDLTALLPIARSSYTFSRYYFDHRFPVEQCERFYADWLAKSVRRELGTAVFVIDDAEGPAGYIALDHQTAATAAISLVGVAERARGTGIGQRLVQQALAWAGTEGYGRVEVVTQGRNYPAQRLYQRCGFVTKKTELWYHRWK